MTLVISLNIPERDITTRKDLIEIYFHCGFTYSDIDLLLPVVNNIRISPRKQMKRVLRKNNLIDCLILLMRLFSSILKKWTVYRVPFHVVPFRYIKTRNKILTRMKRIGPEKCLYGKSIDSKTREQSKECKLCRLGIIKESHMNFAIDGYTLIAFRR